MNDQDKYLSLVNQPSIVAWRDCPIQGFLLIKKSDDKIFDFILRRGPNDVSSDELCDRLRPTIGRYMDIDFDDIRMKHLGNREEAIKELNRLNMAGSRTIRAILKRYNFMRVQHIITRNAIHGAMRNPVNQKYDTGMFLNLNSK